MKSPVVAIFFLAVAGCAPKVLIPTVAPADADIAKVALEPGTSSVHGSALLRQRGGGVVTCAGNDVYLIPATESATRELRRIFGSDKALLQHGGTAMGGGKLVRPPDPNRTASCNAQGFFSFNNMKAGRWYIMTTVTWEVPNPVGFNTEGGTLLGITEASDGRDVEITLAF